MKKLILIFGFCLIASTVYASHYIVERADGTVVEIVYVDGARKSLSRVVDGLGLTGRPIFRTKPEDIALMDSEHPKYWRINQVPIGSRLKIDTAAKAADEGQATADGNRRRALALKMGLNPTEFQEAKDLGLFKK